MRAVIAIVAVVAALWVEITPVPRLGPLPPASAGRCPREFGRGTADSPSLTGSWEMLDWYEIDARGVPVQVVRAREARGRRPVELERRVAASVPVEIASGATVLAGVDGDRAHYVASLRPDGSVVFLGPCAYGATQTFAAHVRRAGGNPHHVFRAILRDPDGPHATALARGGPVATWWDLPPDERRIGFGAEPATPPDVMRKTREALLTVVVPPGWRERDAAVCTRSPLGWGAECSLLTASPDGEVTFHAWFARGEPLEVWLMRLPGATEERIGVVATIPARYAGRETVRLVPDPAVRTWADLVRVATTTHDALRVR